MIIDIYKIPKSKLIVCYSCDTELYGSKGKPIIDDWGAKQDKKGELYMFRLPGNREKKRHYQNIWTKSCEHKILYRTRRQKDQEMELSNYEDWNRAVS